MRIRILGGALVAVVTFTGVLAGQGAAPTVTPMPWEPNRSSESAEAIIERNAQSAELRARLLETLAALRQSQGPESPRTSQPAQIQSSPLAGVNECTLPDRTVRPINAKVTFNGWSYLCVEVLDNQLARRGAGWIRVAD